MVEFLEAPWYSYGCILRGPPVFVYLNFLGHPGFGMFGLFEALRFPNGWTFRGTPVFVWLDF